MTDPHPDSPWGARPGDVWRCPDCGWQWSEDGHGSQDMAVECGPCDGTMEFIGTPPPEEASPQARLAAAREFVRRPDTLDAVALDQLRSILDGGSP